MGEVVHLNFTKPPSNIQKLNAFKKHLDKGVVLILLDSSRPGVVVPPQYAGDEVLGLNFSYSYELPDFGFDEAGVSATLSFDEGYFFCQIPWGSVYRIGDQFWSEDFP